MNVDQPFSYALSPVKTLWFEFLLSPELLSKHLQEKNPDPSSIELICSFLTNAFLIANSYNNNDENQTNGLSIASNGVNTINLNNLDGKIDTNGSLTDYLNGANNRKCYGLKLLAVKVAAFLNFDLDILEQNLPINMQSSILNELIKMCDNNLGNNCSLFSYINYYRWILRSIIKLSYPNRKSYSIPVPLLQQIDPCYLPPETIDIWFKKLRDSANTAVNGLEKVIKENELKEITNIIMPKFECFKPLLETSNQVFFDWQQVKKLNTNEIMDLIKFELGKWFFFNENYNKASSYFNKISTKDTENFPHLDELKIASDGMIENVSLDQDNHNNNLIDIADELNKISINECLDIVQFENALNQEKLIQEMKKKLKENKKSETFCKNIKIFAYYLSCKISGFNSKLSQVYQDENFGLLGNSEKKNCINIHADNQQTNKQTKNSIVLKENFFKNDLDLELIESTDPDVILNLVNKIKKDPEEINKLWEIPELLTNCLESTTKLSKHEYNKIFLILTKAFELRSAKFYTEARTLFLSVVEDIQTNMHQLAELITFEILLTDLEIQAESKDVDERKISELIEKCEQILIKEKCLSEFSPRLLHLSCIFLLEFDVPILKNYLGSLNPIIKLTASLYCLNNSNQPGFQTLNCAKELLCLILSMFKENKYNITANFAKRRKPIQPLYNKILSIESISSYLSSLKSLKYIQILTSCFAKIHNLIKDNQGLELTPFNCIQISWPNTIGISEPIDENKISFALKLLLDNALKYYPNDIPFIKCKAELALVESFYHESLRNFINILIIKTEYFKSFDNFDDESIIQKMITCSVKLACLTQAVVLHQMTKEINYQLIFKVLAERTCFDSCDDLYDCIWDITILEFLANMYYRKGELDRKTKVIRLIGQLELNANNSEDIRREAANIRRGKFFRYMAKKYL